MTLVVTLEDFRPSPRYDSTPWTKARIEEATTSAGPWQALETINLSPDADPANPAYRNFTTALGSAEDLWYRVVFLDASNNTALPTYPVQNTASDRPVYATVEELASILKVSASSRHASLRRVLESASLEIDSEIGTADIYGSTLPYGAPPSLVQEVCLERAHEHWKQQEVPFGIVGVGGLDASAMYIARDSWDRHALKLSPLKASWGIA